jgi:hypothetical protein
MNVIFLLGAERSGSTWLANIFDAHPAVDAYMEPLADFARIFPEVPARHISIDEVDGLGLRQPLERLRKLKYPLLYRPGMPGLLKDLEFRAFKTLIRLGARRSASLHLAFRRYKALNLNSSKIPRQYRSNKAASPKAFIVKELRLNFKARALAVDFPLARVVIAIRNPGAQITSVISLIQKGRLGELRRGLPFFLEAVRHQRKLQKYQSLLANLRGPDDLEGQLILWWIVNYDVLLHDVRLSRLPYRVIRHEEIATNPHVVASELLAWCDLSYNGPVQRYVDFSSTTQAADPAAIDTSRNSNVYVRDALARVNPDLVDRIDACMRLVALEPELTSYCHDGLRSSLGY